MDQENTKLEEELQRLREALGLDVEGDFSGTGRFELRSESYVRISEDEMEAYLFLAEPIDCEYKREDLIQMLAQQGVIYGLNQSNLAAMVKKKIYEREVKVAEGFPTVSGKDGYYEYFFAPENIGRQPIIREDGSVDYSSMNTLQNVKRGDVIAEYHPAVLGQDGCTVKGCVKKPDPVKELKPLTGRGIFRQEKTNSYVAITDGKIEGREGKIDIQTVHEVHGDVDLVTGKVEFYGDVIIYGNVSAGVTVRAGRNLTIMGTVEHCNLSAGGDILLQRGIQGAERAKVAAQGNVYAEFIEYSNVKAKGDVQANAIMNSEIYANGRVKVSGRKGAIIGGYVHGLCGVEAQKLGNEKEVRTVVHAGFLPESYEKYLTLGRLEAEQKKKLLDNIKEMISILKVSKVKGTTAEQDHRLKHLNLSKDELMTALEQLNAEREKYLAETEKGKDAVVVIKGTIFRGSVISMEDARMPILKQDSFMKYTVNSGVINGKVIAI